MIELSRRAMMKFAKNWMAAWNRRDLIFVKSHLAEDAEFTSPLAYKYYQRCTMRGAREISAYWETALADIDLLKFTLDYAIWNQPSRRLLIVYDANINGQHRRACELMYFNVAGEQMRGEALYGALS